MGRAIYRLEGVFDRKASHDSPRDPSTALVVLRHVSNSLLPLAIFKKNIKYNKTGVKERERERVSNTKIMLDRLESAVKVKTHLISNQDP